VSLSEIHFILQSIEKKTWIVGDFELNWGYTRDLNRILESQYSFDRRNKHKQKVRICSQTLTAPTAKATTGTETCNFS
jgi:hypothetical protein